MTSEGSPGKEWDSAKRDSKELSLACFHPRVHYELSLDLVHGLLTLLGAACLTQTPALPGRDGATAVLSGLPATAGKFIPLPFLPNMRMASEF